MRVGAREADARAQPGTRLGWFVAAFISVAAAAVYLCLSIAQAIAPRHAQVSDVAVVPVVSSRVETSRDTAPTSVPEPPRQEPPVREPHPGLAQAVFDPALHAALEEAVAEGNEHIAVAVKRVSDGRFASFNGDFQFYAASTFKLAVLYETERRHFNGDLAYDDTIMISDEDAIEDLGTSGYLEFEDDGSITIQHLLEAMIEVSDNSSAVALMHEFGSRNIDSTLRELGVTTMTLNQTELWTTADDLARLMEAIYVGEGVGPEERAHMRELLLAQTVRYGIPAALASEVREGLMIGNKTGTWEGAQHDVAFVEAQTGAYVIAILTDGSWEGWQALYRVAVAMHREMLKAS